MAFGFKTEYTRLPNTPRDCDAESLDGPSYASGLSNGRGLLAAVTARAGWLMATLLLAILSFGGGFMLGGSGYGNGFARSSTVPFIYNATFAMAPSDTSNRAWNSLMPEGRGFVLDAQGEVHGLTVFHQLHCLDMLRHGFYNTTHHSPSSTDDGQDPAVHGRHCFDYLRQTVQCAADTNREPVNWKLGGVRGWTPHRCADFKAVRSWAEANQAPGRGGGSSGAHGHGHSARR